jgi:hypothetical protein
VINYRRTNSANSPDLSGIERLRRLQFGVLAARGGMHMALVINGSVYEVHWTSAATDRNSIQATPSKASPGRAAPSRRRAATLRWLGGRHNEAISVASATADAWQSLLFQRQLSLLRTQPKRATWWSSMAVRKCLVWTASTPLAMSLWRNSRLASCTSLRSISPDFLLRAILRRFSRQTDGVTGGRTWPAQPPINLLSH